jgi:penicillin-binding protein 1A
MCFRPSRRLFSVLTLALPAALLVAPPVAHGAPFDLPPIDRIVHYQPKLPLQVFTADGVELAQFGTERREYVPLSKTPKLLQDAVLAVEDVRFREHSGVDPKGMARAALALVTGGRKQGASTITQQLVRTMLLTRELTFERKAKEIMLAFKVEEALSKDRILEIYLNEIFLGQRAYGFAAAAKTYFGKPMDQLSIAETAMLAGLPQNPYYANPVANMQRATARQRVVLQRMHTVGVISDAQLAKARAEKLVLRPRDRTTSTPPTWPRWRAGGGRTFRRQRLFTRYPRHHLAARRPTSAPPTRPCSAACWHRTGAAPGAAPKASARSASDGPELERAAAEILKDHRDDDLLRGHRAVGQSQRSAGAAGQRRAGAHHRRRSALGAAGLSPKAKETLRIRRGSVLRVVQNGSRWAISQWPEAEAALVALDTRTGRVRALVGGFDFTRQPFNHVTVLALQARHQLGRRHHGLDGADALAAAPDVLPGLLGALAAEVHLAGVALGQVVGVHAGVADAGLR